MDDRGSFQRRLTGRLAWLGAIVAGIIGLVGGTGSSWAQHRVVSAARMPVPQPPKVTRPAAPPPKTPAPRYTAQMTGASSAVNLAYLQGKKEVAPDEITTLGPDAFGDRINLFNGSFSFEHTDISIPGNSELPVALVRSQSPGRYWLVRGVMADWDLETPRVQGTFAVPEGWTGGWDGTGGRCSAYSMPRTVTVGYQYEEGYYESTDVAPHEYWQGTSIVIPSHGSQEILGNSRLPTGGGLWPHTTRQQWQVGCEGSLLNAQGEGFRARSPQGVTYVFNWMASRFQRELRRGGILMRADMFLMATSVTDRFGNWVRYTYNPAKPMQLTRIEASDGRVITLTYSGDRLVSASDADPGVAGRRTWTYAYHANGDLASVTQPDQTRWQFNLRGFVTTSEIVNEGFSDCDGYPQPNAYGGTGSITHPSGAVATFRADWALQPRSNVPRHCTYYSGDRAMWTNGSVYPRETMSFALQEKTIAAPGAPTRTWTYGSNGHFGCWAPCSANSKTVTVTEPDQTVKRYIYGIRWRENEGQLLRTEEGATTSSPSPLRTVENSYAAPVSGSFPDSFGDSPNLLFDWNSTVNRPQSLRTTTQEGSWAQWQALRFDSRARAVETQHQSSQGHLRRERVTLTDAYLHLGVVGLPVSREVDVGGVWKQPEATGYDTLARPESKSAFGFTTTRLGYHTNGLLAWVSDGANANRIDVDNYFRGRPQRARFADGTQATQVIDNAGRTTSHTNEAGTTHTLWYDAMGRLERIRYPTGDPTAYCDTVLSFTRSTSAERGLPAGHWKQRIETCGDVTERWFDGLWQMRLQARYDTSSPATTAAYTEKRYDATGRVVFASRALRSIAAVSDVSAGGNLTGTSTAYDGLGRVRSETQHNGSGGVRTTSTVYEAGFTKAVTNPRGFTTRSSRQVFDDPEQGDLIYVSAPEGVQLSLLRDVLGKAHSITRSGPVQGAGGSVSATRRYLYDAHERLCATVEPETGATVRDYDASGRLAWVATGIAATSDCASARSAAVAQRRISHEYDLRSRLWRSLQGDGQGVIERAYTADGLPSTLTSTRPGRGFGRWSYHYNNARVLWRERFSWGDSANDWIWDYSLDPRRNRSSMHDAFGTLNFEPDAQGRPRRLHSPSFLLDYARDVLHHPDGSLASYTLGNGVAFSMQQDGYGAPALWHYAGRLQHSYAYDDNGNVSSILDTLAGQHRSMPGYDGLDRLRQANGPWGSARYDYDALDNIVASSVGQGTATRALTHHHDRSRNQLLSLQGSNAGTPMAVHLAYDSAGNLTQRGSTSFSFDIANRLSNSSVHTALEYDAHGRRHFTQWSTGQWRRTAYTQDGVLRLDRHSAEGWRRYVHLGGKLIAEHRDSNNGHELTYALTDALGSPVQRVNAQGTSIQTTHYEPYGSTATAPGLNSTPPPRVGFTGHASDNDTGLVYMQQRYYDPLAGRFLSVDPVVTDQWSGEFFNRYEYAESNPYKYRDPDGRAVETPWDGVNVGIGVASLVRNVATGNLVGAAVDAAGIIIDAAATATPGVPGGAATAIQAYRAAGVAREAVVAERLAIANPGAQIQGQRMLRTADGKKAIDPVTKEGRVVDHAVIKDGKAATFETTSMTADKSSQMAKEQRIRDTGGTFIRDKETRAIVPVVGRSEIVRER